MVSLTSNNKFGICDTSLEGHDIINSMPANGAFVMYVRTGDMIYTFLTKTSSSPATTSHSTGTTTERITTTSSSSTTTSHSTGTTTERITTSTSSSSSTTTKLPNFLKTVYIVFETDTCTCNPNDVLYNIDISGHASNQYINYDKYTKVMQSDTYTFVPYLKYPYIVKYADSGLDYNEISKEYGIGINVGFNNEQPETLQLILKLEDCEITNATTLTTTNHSTDTTTSPASTITTTSHSTDTTTEPITTSTTTNHSTDTTTERVTTSTSTNHSTDTTTTPASTITTTNHSTDTTTSHATTLTSTNHSTDTTTSPATTLTSITPTATSAGVSIMVHYNGNEYVYNENDDDEWSKGKLSINNYNNGEKWFDLILGYNVYSTNDYNFYPDISYEGPIYNIKKDYGEHDGYLHIYGDITLPVYGMIHIYLSNGPTTISPATTLTVTPIL